MVTEQEIKSRKFKCDFEKEQISYQVGDEEMTIFSEKKRKLAKTLNIYGRRVVGWYKDATVYRYPQYEFCNEREQQYNFIDKKENCVLLPENERFSSKWIVPSSGHNGYDF